TLEPSLPGMLWPDDLQRAGAREFLELLYPVAVGTGRAQVCQNPAQGGEATLTTHVLLWIGNSSQTSVTPGTKTASVSRAFSRAMVSVSPPVYAMRLPPSYFLIIFRAPTLFVRHLSAASLPCYPAPT